MYVIVEAARRMSESKRQDEIRTRWGVRGGEPPRDRSPNPRGAELKRRAA